MLPVLPGEDSLQIELLNSYKTESQYLFQKLTMNCVPFTSFITCGSGLAFLSRVCWGFNHKRLLVGRNVVSG